jgi:predicted TIM-barrel fold metal-dependent hydrolase
MIAVETRAAAAHAYATAHAVYLQSNVPGLTADESVTVARQGIGEHLERIEERAASGHLRAGVDVVSERPLYVTVEAARRAVRRRTIEANRELLQAVYARSCEELEAAGLGFDLLLAYHRGDGRGG